MFTLTFRNFCAGHSSFSLFFSLIVAFCLSSLTPAVASELMGRVVGVLDGYTIDVLRDDNTPFRIRIGGIDAPEKKQPFGQVTKKMLSDLAFK